MKTQLLLLASAAITLGSCTSMYKLGQTPDDVYYSPGIESSANRTRETVSEEEDGYVDLSDRYLRMKSSSKRWSTFDDDFSYWNNPGWNSQYMFNSFYSPYSWNSGFNVGIGYGSYGYPWSWNTGIGWGSSWYNPWYNPFCPGYYGHPVVIVSPKPVYVNPRANGPRTYNLNTYSNSGRPNYLNPKTGSSSYPYNSGSSRVRVFNSVNSTTTQTGGGRYIRTDGTGTGSSARPRGGYNNTDNSSGGRSNPSRSFEYKGGSTNNGSSGGSSGSRSSGSSAPTRSFGRGGN